MSDQSYLVDDRRRTAAMAAVEGIPTEALERGIVQELYALYAVVALANHMLKRRDGSVLIPSGWWDAYIQCQLDALNVTCNPAWTRNGGESH